MKLSAGFFIGIICLLSCNGKQESIAEEKWKTQNVYFPFAPIYSNNFEKGDPKKAEMVLQVWRQYETGRVSQTGKYFADSIRFILPDQILIGKKDSILRLYENKRTGYSNMQCFIYSWMPVHVEDKNENMVFVWGLYDGTKLNGDRDYALVHEIWRFDHNGKIKELEQFRTHPH